MESINTVLTLAGSLLILIFILLQWFLRKDSKDRRILRRPPYPEPLPQHDLEIATREWHAWRDKYQKKPVHEKNRLEREYIKREKAFTEERDTFHEAQRPYQLACEELSIAWRNFRDVFNSLSFVERWFAGETAKELSRVRQIHSEVAKKVKWEKEKWHSRRRIKRVEEKVDETSVQSKPEAISGEDEELMEEEIPTLPETDHEKDTQEKPEKTAEEVFSEALQPVSNEDEFAADLLEEEAEIIEVHFTQEDVKEFYPDFREKTYIDEVFMPEPFYAGVIKSAVFIKTRFVGVQFKGVHQYQKCHFQGADFSAAVFHPAKKPHRFLYCNFTRSRWNGAKIEVAAFYLCKFKGVNFARVELRKIKFVQCDLSEAKLKGADFSRCVMSRDMLESLDFSECLLPPANYSKLEVSQEQEPGEEQADPEGEVVNPDIEHDVDQYEDMKSKPEEIPSIDAEQNISVEPPVEKKTAFEDLAMEDAENPTESKTVIIKSEEKADESDLA